MNGQQMSEQQFMKEAVGRANAHTEAYKSIDRSVYPTDSDWLRAIMQRFSIVYAIWQEPETGDNVWMAAIKGARNIEPPSPEQSDQWTAVRACSVEEAAAFAIEFGDGMHRDFAKSTH